MFYGVDFSGAAQAGKKIWITTAENMNGKLYIHDLKRAQDLPNSGPDVETALNALVDFIIAAQPRAIFAMDFPFGLPRELVYYSSWVDFVLKFGDDYPAPEVFPAFCKQAAGGRELKRLTDKETRTPFCSYNLRIYRQTFHGIRDVLAPLLREDLVSVLPMMRALEKPWLIEVCPASTLKKMNHYIPYKGRAEKHRAARERILMALESVEMSSKMRQRYITDTEGDALDSLIAAYTAFKVFTIPTELFLYANNWVEYQIEGYVYA